MRTITYLDSTAEDLRWFFRYYSRIFPQGGAKASASLAETENLLLNFPNSGHPIPDSTNRERRVSNTPFNLVYRVKEDRIEVLRVRDTRSNP